MVTACGGGGGGGGGGVAPQTVTGGPNDRDNSSPNISGTPPPETAIGATYIYVPRVSDPDGDPLAFSIRNKPDWASFDPESGKLSGVASAGSEGTYSDITITVSDGQLTDSTVFTVEVTQAGSGAITLSWQPPTQNEDGTPLTDLVGYNVYYGTVSGQYSESVEIEQSGIVTYVIENLSPNTYYLVSTAVNSDGVESDYSNEAVLSVSGS